MWECVLMCQCKTESSCGVAHCVLHVLTLSVDIYSIAMSTLELSSYTMVCTTQAMYVLAWGIYHAVYTIKIILMFPRAIHGYTNGIEL